MPRFGGDADIIDRLEQLIIIMEKQNRRLAQIVLLLKEGQR